MKKIFIAFIMIFTVSFTYTMEGEFSLEREVLTDNIIEKEPNLSVDNFNLYAKGFYFTEFINIGEERTIYHNWYYLGEGDEKTLTASVPLQIAGYRWRTWSNKNLYLPGEWKIEVVDEAGVIITEINFNVE